MKRLLFLLIFLLLLNTGMRTADPMIKSLTEQLIKQTKTNKKQNELILLLESEKAVLKREVIRHKKTEAVMKLHREAGNLDKYSWLTHEYIYQVIVWGEKYRHLTKNYDYSTFDPENFYLLWITNETHGNPDPDLIILNKYGTKDYWIMQLNEVHYKEKNPAKNLWRRVEKLYPHLRFKPDWDVEKNIAAWSLWLGEEKRYGVWKLWNGCDKLPGWKARPDLHRLHYLLRSIG